MVKRMDDSEPNSIWRTVSYSPFSLLELFGGGEQPSAAVALAVDDSGTDGLEVEDSATESVDAAAPCMEGRNMRSGLRGFGLRKPEPKTA